MSPHGEPFFFTWTDQRSAVPLEIVGGEGVYFETADGSRWLDFGSLSYQASLGHNETRVIDAVKRQVETLALAMPNAVFPAKRELAERLLELAPDGFSRVFFTLGGSEANENALKIARAHTGRRKLISRYRSYHGATMGALALTGDWRRPAAQPTVGGIVHALDCYCDACPFGQAMATCKRECALHIGDLLELEGRGTVAGIMLEPIPGANGVLVPPDEYWPMVRKMCDEDGALLIADEVLTGFGRTGTCFAVEHWNVVPDIITIAKGLTAGYAPLGAVLVHERVARHFDDKVLAAGLTHYGHPLGCAAGLASLGVYEDDKLFERAARLGPSLLSSVRALTESVPDHLGPVRGLGLLVCVEVAASKEQWERLAAELAERHISLHVDPRRGHVIFAPPLIIDEEELGRGVALFGAAVLAVFGG